MDIKYAKELTDKARKIFGKIVSRAFVVIGTYDISPFDNMDSIFDYDNIIQYGENPDSKALNKIVIEFINGNYVVFSCSDLGLIEKIPEDNLNEL